MSLSVQYASIAAWSDEARVRDNRSRYRDKFAAVGRMLKAALTITTARIQAADTCASHPCRR